MSSLVNWFKKFFSKNNKHKEEKTKPFILDKNTVNNRNDNIRRLRQEQNIDKSKIECPSCHSKVIELTECAICHKQGCPECLNYDILEKKYYCDKCSDNMVVMF